MRVFVAGGGGMVGRNIRAHVRAQQHEVLAPPRSELDLADRAALLAYFQKHRPGLVIHCAGRVGGIEANMAAPAAFLVENFEIGRAIVLAARDAGVPRLLNFSSSCVYPKDIDGLLREEMTLSGPLEPTNEGYALAKLAVMRLCQYAMHETPGLHYKSIIPCNLYGPHDKFDAKNAHLVPAVIAKVHAAMRERRGSIDIWGDGTARREFLYAGDLADFVWEAVARFDDLPDVMNVGFGEDLAVNDYYRVIAETLGWKGAFTHDLSKPTGMRRKVVDVTRQRQFGWRPSTTLGNGVAATYEYFLRTQNNH